MESDGPIYDVIQTKRVNDVKYTCITFYRHSETEKTLIKDKSVIALIANFLYPVVSEIVSLNDSNGRKIYSPFKETVC